MKRECFKGARFGFFAGPKGEFSSGIGPKPVSDEAEIAAAFGTI
jgi:hypothetical protein